MLVIRSARRLPFYKGQGSYSTAINKFEDFASTVPMKEIVRYTEKNMKWTYSEFKKFGDSHANGLIDYGFKTGESIAVWHKDSAERHITLWAALKIGLKVYDFDSSITTVEDVRQALLIAQCKAIVFEPVTDKQDNLLLLRKSIPEFYSYDDFFGQSFHSKFYPDLEYFIHTGFDVENGCLNHRHIYLPDPEVSLVDGVAAANTDDLPFYTKIFKDSATGRVAATPTLTQGEVVKQVEAIPFISKLVNKEYFEV